jgi:phosphoglycolate phosphatase
MHHTNLPSPTAVLFDWDNTLVNSWATGLHAINHTLSHFGLPTYSLDELKQRPARALRENFPPLFGDNWKDAAQIYYQAYREVHLDLLEPHDQAEELLQLLNAHDIYMGIVSNKLGDNLRLEVAHLGWEKYFRTIVGSKDTSHDKPSAIPVLRALHKLDTKLGPHIWFIGDSEVDMSTARDNQLTGIYVGENDNIAKMQETHPQINDFNNLKDILTFISSNPNIFTR